MRGLMLFAFTAAVASGTAHGSLAPADAWVAEPVWLTRPTVDMTPEPPVETRPEPIPLPPAALVGPIVLTSVLAAAVLKKRRQRFRVIR